MNTLGHVSETLRNPLNKLNAGLAVAASAVALMGAGKAQAAGYQAPTKGYVDAELIDCAPYGDDLVFTGGACMENPKGYPIIPTKSLELQKVYKRMPDEGCDTIFASPNCGVKELLLTPSMLEFMTYRLVPTPDCYMRSTITDECLR